MTYKNNMNSIHFGCRLTELMDQWRLTNASLATDLGVDRNSVWRWRKEAKPPKGPAIRQLSKYFGISEDVFLGEHTPQLPPRTADGVVMPAPALHTQDDAFLRIIHIAKQLNADSLGELKDIAERMFRTQLSGRSYPPERKGKYTKPLAVVPTVEHPKPEDSTH